MKIRLLDREHNHLCDWTIRPKPITPGQAQAPAAPKPFAYPKMVLWPGGHGEADRFFAIDPDTLPSKPRPAAQPGQIEPEIIATYNECDEPLEIGRLY